MPVPPVDLAQPFRVFRGEAGDCGGLVALCLRCDRGQRYCAPTAFAASAVTAAVKDPA
jgi:hypothetical protein